jgi:hypothetical protein
MYRRLAQSPGSSLTALGVLLSLAAVILFVVGVQARYADRIAAAKTDALNFANILAEHTVLTFEEVDRALRRAEAIRRDSLSGRFDPGATNAALRQLQRSSSVIVAIGWTDASGRVVAHSYGSAPPRPNISDMPHFEGSFDRTAVALSIMCDLPIGLVERVLVQNEPEQLLVFAKAIDLSWETVRAMLALQGGRGGLARERLNQCLASFFRLRPKTALTALQFYLQREQARRSAALDS